MPLPLGFSPVGLVAFVLLTFLIATTVNTFAMEAAVLFTPAFLFVYPQLVPAFPDVGTQAAIGLALFVELFGYTSSVSAYYLRDQVDLGLAKSILAVSIPVAVVARTVSYYAPADALMLAFGGMLAALAAVLFQAHRHGSTVVDWIRGTPLERFVGDRVAPDGGRVVASEFDRFDRAVAGLGGVMAGLVGIAIGELSQTLLTVRKRIPFRLSTGTSALVLHGTIVSALVTNVALLVFAPGLSGHSLTVPFEFGTVAGLTCVLGGQTGAYINSRVTEQTTLRAMMIAYTAVGVLVVARVLFL